MSLQELRDAMALARKIRDVKHQEFLLAEAKYNLRLAEIELGKQHETIKYNNVSIQDLRKELERRDNGTDKKVA